MVGMFSVDYLNELRLAELERVTARIPSNSAILELGAGTGIQAKALQEQRHQRRCNVLLPESSLRQQRPQWLPYCFGRMASMATP
jgi:hypothetical protein